MSAAFVAWVVGDPNDPSLAELDALRGEVTVVLGGSVDAFAGRPKPHAIMFATGTTALFERVWSLAGGAPWVHSRFAGVEHVLFPALVASDAVVTNGRGAFAPSLAEFTIGALLFFAKDFRRMVDSQRAGRWDPFEPAELRGQTLGIVGYGAIGAATAALAKAFGMRVVAARRHPHRSHKDRNVDAVASMTELSGVFDESDHVLVCAPLTKETRGLVGAPEIARMKAHGVLVNVGRGPVVDERALLDALAASRIRGAALDVFDTEPLPAGHPFYQSERVLLSPHCADRVPGWLHRATAVFVENVRRRLKGDDLLNVVDKALGY